MKKLDPEALKLAVSFLRDFSNARNKLEETRAKLDQAVAAHHGELLDRLTYLVKPLGFTREQVASKDFDLNPETGEIQFGVDELALARQKAIDAKKEREAKLLNEVGKTLADPKPKDGDALLKAFVEKKEPEAVGATNGQ